MQICSATVSLSTCRSCCWRCILEQSLSWQHYFVYIIYSTTSCVVFSDVSCMSSYQTHFFVRTIAIQLHLELKCVHWPLLHSLLVMLNCPLVLGNMADSPSGPWLCSIVSSATSSDADSVSAYFSSSNFFELIIRIVLWRHAMCSILHALCCRQGGEDPIWWCSNTLEGKRAFISQHSFREDQGYAACST